ncbi:MAG: prepilin peptidase [Candidatus Hydromicrobium americanum]|nr:MAG: prepilin peptidase [Candidatus Hydromicrobium americanum]
MEIREVIFYIIFIISGLVAGSFLEVVIHRVPRKLSIIKPASFCPSCKRKIAFYDNIPLVSFIMLKGRCRYCKNKIPVTSLLVEVLTSLLFLANYIFFRLTIKTLVGIILCSVLIVISFIDIDFRIIPNVIVLPFTVVGLALSIISDLSRWWMPLVFSLGAFLFMLVIHLIYPRGMGMGDVKLSLMVGAFLVRNVITALFLGFLAGSIYGLSFIAIKKGKLKQAVPFGPFISLGSIISLFWGDNILKWYISFLR